MGALANGPKHRTRVFFGLFLRIRGTRFCFPGLLLVLLVCHEIGLGLLGMLARRRQCTSARQRTCKWRFEFGQNPVVFTGHSDCGKGLFRRKRRKCGAIELIASTEGIAFSNQCCYLGLAVLKELLAAFRRECSIRD